MSKYFGLELKAALSFNRRAFYLFFFAVLLDVIEAKSEDLNDDLEEDFHPIGVLRLL